MLKKIKALNQGVNPNMLKNSVGYDELFTLSQSISSELDIEKLMEKLLVIFLHKGTAEKGAIILKERSSWIIRAYGNSEKINFTNTSIRKTSNQPISIPEKLIEKVILSKQTYVLNNVYQETQTPDDDLTQNKTKSNICFPLKKYQKLIGIVYLENSKIGDEFTLEQQRFFEVLATQAAISLDNAKLYRESVNLTAAYASFVPRDLLKLLDKENIADIYLGDHIEKNMTVLFADIRGFTQRSETLSPGDNFNFINDYLGEMEPLFRFHQGFIVKYIGDAIMALFPGKVEDALDCAKTMLNRISELNKRYQNNPISIGIGIHTGPIILGIVGGYGRLEGTVISDAVNLASRIEGLNKRFQTRCLVSEDSIALLPENHPFSYRYLGQVKVKGKQKQVKIYEFLLPSIDH